MPMNFLIAGATGKTGLHLTQNLLDQGHNVTALVRESSDTSTLPGGTDLRHGDLTDLQPGVCDGADVVMALRIQLERMKAGAFPTLREYAALYGVNAKRFARAAKDAIVMHPGPMNRGVEITSEIADGDRSVILNQVTNGVAVRMAVLYLLAAGREPRP